MTPEEQTRLAELERCARHAEKAGSEADAEKDAAKSETERCLAAGASIAAWAIAAAIRSEK